MFILSNFFFSFYLKFFTRDNDTINSKKIYLDFYLKTLSRNKQRWQGNN